MIVIHIAGHLGQDPEVRFTPTNKKVTTLRVATNIKRGSKEKTVWWKVTLWGDRFDQKVSYLKKGSSVIVIGEMGIPEIYTDRDGNPQTSFEIVADSIIFNPFGGKSGPGDRQMMREEGADSSDEYSQSSSMGMMRKESSSRQMHEEKSPASLRQPGVMQGTGSSYSPTQSHSDFDSEDDIPF